MEKGLTYHLIGIGGAGMSAIAHILHQRGEHVTGSDNQVNDAVMRLRGLGVQIEQGHSATHINGADVVVYSAAISQDNPEIVEAKKKGLVLLERPAMLGKIMEPYASRIAVSGTHGKTTTTSMISSIFDSAQLDATTLIGGDLKVLGGNAFLGKGSVVLTEACEAFESFLHLNPTHAVITNIEGDHLDYYKTVEAVETSFRQFLGQVDEDGIVLANASDDRTRRVAEECGRKVLWYGLDKNCDLYLENVDIEKAEPEFDIVYHNQNLGRVTLGVPGMHNVFDALAAIATCLQFDIPFENIVSALAGFKGAGRRFEVLFERDGLMVVDDYAHHPSEVLTTLESAKSAYKKHVTVVFQPHLYSRTKIFAEDFAHALMLADEVFVTSIYASREKHTDEISGQNIVDLMEKSGFKRASYVEEMAAIPSVICSELDHDDMVIFMGAGDIRKAGEKLASMLENRQVTI